LHDYRITDHKRYGTILTKYRKLVANKIRTANGGN